MSDFRVFETAEFARTLGALSPRDARAIRKKLAEYVYPQIRQAPFFGVNIKRLRGYVPDTWRYRIGKFRLFYAIDREDRVVYILAVEHRGDAYR